MGKVIAVVNQKGGVGKTVTVSTLAAILTDRGFKVLSISMDPQQTLDMTAGEGVAIDSNDTVTPSMLHALKGQCSLKDCIVTNTNIGDIARASAQMSQWLGFQGFSMEEYLAVCDDHEALKQLCLSAVYDETHAYCRLRELLLPVVDSYDFILIDPNPALTLLTLNSIFASEFLIVPAQTEYASAHAIGELKSTVEALNRMDPERPPTKYLGVLMTRCNAQLVNYKNFVELCSQIADMLGTRVFDSRIRQSSKVLEIVQNYTDLFHYSPRSKVTADYIAFADEFLKLIQEA